MFYKYFEIRSRQAKSQSTTCLLPMLANTHTAKPPKGVTNSVSKRSPLTQSTKFDTGDLLYIFNPEDLSLRKFIVFDIIHKRYGGPSYMGAQLKHVSGFPKTIRFDDYFVNVYRDMHEAFTVLNAMAKDNLELTMDPLKLSKSKANIYYLQDDKIVRCFVSEVNDAGYTLQHFDENRERVFCAHGEHRVFYKSVRNATKAKLFNDDLFKLDFIRSKVGSSVSYLMADHEKETAHMEKCKITEIQDDVSNHTRIYTLQPYGKPKPFQVSGSDEYVFFNDSETVHEKRRRRKGAH
jgi:hypothetical protein